MQFASEIFVYIIQKFHVFHVHISKVNYMISKNHYFLGKKYLLKTNIKLSTVIVKFGHVFEIEFHVRFNFRTCFFKKEGFSHPGGARVSKILKFIEF